MLSYDFRSVHSISFGSTSGVKGVELELWWCRLGVDGGYAGFCSCWGREKYPFN